MAAEIKRGAALETKLGTTMTKVHEALLTVIDDSIEEEVNREVHREDYIYVMKAEHSDKPKDVLEIFTAVEQVRKQAERKGLHTMKSVSLETGFDLKQPRAQREVLHRVQAEKPFLIVMAFPCELWSSLQYLRKDQETLREDERQLLKFVKVVCRMQRLAGRHFLLENPAGSAAWREPYITELGKMKDVGVVKSDMCAFGKCNTHGELLKKPTKFMSSSPWILKFLDRRCQGGHKHGDFLKFSNTKATGEYTPALAAAIVKGLKYQKAADDAKVACPVEADQAEETYLMERRRRWGEPAEHGALPATLEERGLNAVLKRPGGPDILDAHPRRRPRSNVPALSRLLRRPGGPDLLDGHPKRRKKRSEENEEMNDDEDWEWREEFEEAPRSPDPEPQDADDFDQNGTEEPLETDPDVFEEKEDTDDAGVTADNDDIGDLDDAIERYVTGSTGASGSTYRADDPAAPEDSAAARNPDVTADSGDIGSKCYTAGELGGRSRSEERSRSQERSRSKEKMRASVFVS